MIGVERQKSKFFARGEGEEVENYSAVPRNMRVEPRLSSSVAVPFATLTIESDGSFPFPSIPLGEGRRERTPRPLTAKHDNARS